MLFNTGRFGTLRDIATTDMRDLLLFMAEYPQFVKEKPPQRLAYADEVDWL